MPIHIDIDTDEVISLEEYLAYVGSEVDMRDQDSIIASAPKLKALYNNRQFLAERVNAELRDVANLQDENRYSAQVIMLGQGEDWFVRANFWPSPKERILHDSGTDPFFYYKPHDHNFDFLTVCYYGPGYSSDYYVYDHSKVIGYQGEKVDLQFVEKAQLSQGKMMLYRACVDVHNQLLPEDFSITINLMQNLQDNQTRVNQYYFDLRNQRVRTLANRTSPPLMIDVAAHIGDGNTDELLNTFTCAAYCPRTRVAAYQALARRYPAQAQELWARAAAADNAFVAAHGRLADEALEVA